MEHWSDQCLAARPLEFPGLRHEKSDPQPPRPNPSSPVASQEKSASSRVVNGFAGNSVFLFDAQVKKRLKKGSWDVRCKLMQQALVATSLRNGPPGPPKWVSPPSVELKATLDIHHIARSDCEFDLMKTHATPSSFEVHKFLAAEASVACSKVVVRARTSIGVLKRYFPREPVKEGEVRGMGVVEPKTVRCLDQGKEAPHRKTRPCTGQGV